MARIPDEVINRIKHDVSLLRLIESQGYVVKKQGKDHAVACPFHEDHTPSCIISPKSNLFNCFGCGVGGSIIDWVMRTEKLDFRGAVAKLSDCIGERVAEPKALAAKSLAASLNSAADNQALLKRVIDFYHDTLKQNEEAQAYLTQRGLISSDILSPETLAHPCASADVELINTFKLGYANRSLGLTLPAKQIKSGAEIRTQLQEIGLYRESGHEHFNGSLVVPIINQDGEVTEVYGRKLINNLRKGTPKHLYLPGEHLGVFNESAFVNSDEIILCESLIDALTFWRHGFKNVTTSYGTNGFTSDLLAAFKSHTIKRVLIAYDRDDAGNTAAEKLAKILTKENIDCYRILFPKGMDANEYALQVKPARKSLELVIRKAEWLGVGSPSKENEKTDLSFTAPMHSTTNPSVVLPPASMQSPALTALEHPCSLAASPIPTQKPLHIQHESTDNETVIILENRRYRVRGLSKATSYEQLKINLCITDETTGAMHIDQLDLYNAKHRQSFIKQAAIECGVTDEDIKKDISKVLLKLEQLQDEQIQETVQPKEKAIEISSEESKAALELLRDPSLLSRILEDFNVAGVVGEETNKLVGYLAAVSRKLDSPLAVIIQSTSAAGKSSLMNAVLAMMPEEERIQYSAMTGQSLFYMGETNLKHKILAIAEEEGADQASYALKLLQSEGELTIASTGKDADGNLTTQEYHVEGPVMLFSTTTAIDIDEELMNRCIVLTVNESREQTQLIHELQRERETLEGLLANEDKKAIIQLHRNAQRLLKPIKVVNPFAKHLTFMDNQTRSRRDHMKYLQLIKTIAFLHQYQREIKVINHNNQMVEYIEVELSDIAVANELAHDVLGRSLDELPPQTRTLLELVYTYVKNTCASTKTKKSDFRFSRREIREFTGWGNTQLKTHLGRLEELEYLIVKGGGRGNVISYELQYNGEGEASKSFLMGLIDVKKLGAASVHPCTCGTCASCTSYDAKKSGLNIKKAVLSRGQVAPKSGGSRDSKKQNKPVNTEVNGKKGELNGKTHSTVEILDASHPSHAIPLTSHVRV